MQWRLVDAERRAMNKADAVARSRSALQALQAEQQVLAARTAGQERDLVAVRAAKSEADGLVKLRASPPRPDQMPPLAALAGALRPPLLRDLSGNSFPCRPPCQPGMEELPWLRSLRNLGR